ncbi:MAG TPA: hypothetical protein VIL46_06805 [Gemmataceae bacterium]
MTQDRELRPAVARAVRFIVEPQHEGGGWRYQPRQPGDLSVTGWQLQALHAARLAGIEVPEDTFRRTGKFLDSAFDGKNGTYSYTPRAAKSSVSMTGVGVLARHLLHRAGKEPEVTGGVGFLTKRLPQPAGLDLYSCFYATRAIYETGGPAWKKAWNPAVNPLLVKLQTRGGVHAGSWPPDPGILGKATGRLGTTSLALLSLEVPYRYVPGWARPKLASRRAEPPEK